MDFSSGEKRFKGQALEHVNVHSLRRREVASKESPNWGAPNQREGGSGGKHPLGRTPREEASPTLADPPSRIANRN